MVAISVLLHPVQPGRVARPRRGLSLISAALLYRYRHGDGTCAWHGRAVSYEGGHGRRVPSVAARAAHGHSSDLVARTPGRVQYLLSPDLRRLTPSRREAGRRQRRPARPVWLHVVLRPRGRRVIVDLGTRNCLRRYGQTCRAQENRES